MAGRELTAKQKMFAHEYTIDFNGTQAYIRCGYKAANARFNACRLLTNDNVQEEIKRLMDKMHEKIDVTIESLVQEMAKIGYANMADYVNGDNIVREIKTLDRNKTAAISMIETTVTEMIVNKKPVIKTRTKIGLHSKDGALDKLMRHKGAYKEDNDQQKTVINFPITKTYIKK